MGSGRDDQHARDVHKIIKFLIARPVKTFVGLTSLTPALRGQLRAVLLEAEARRSARGQRTADYWDRSTSGSFPRRRKNLYFYGRPPGPSVSLLDARRATRKRVRRGTWRVALGRRPRQQACSEPARRAGLTHTSSVPTPPRASVLASSRASTAPPAPGRPVIPAPRLPRTRRMPRTIRPPFRRTTTRWG